MANPFAIEPANPLQALMSGVQGYKQAQEDARDYAIDEAGKAIKAGDNPALIDALLRARQIGPAMEMAKLGRQEESSRRFQTNMASWFGGGAQPPASPLTPLMQPPPAPAAAVRPGYDRPEVKSSPTVYGDREAEEAGIYPPSPGTQPAPPVSSPSPAPRAAAVQAPVAVAGQPAPQIGPSHSIAGMQLDKAVPFLFQSALDPNLPKEQQEFARMLIKQAFDQYPSEIRQLEIFRQRPDLYKMALEMKQAGSTLINTAEGMDAAQTKARIAMDQAAIKDLSERVTKSGSGIPLLKHVIEISKDTPQGYAGKLAPFAAKIAATLGIPVPDSLSNAEKFLSITRQLTPSVREPGATSNYENQLYQDALPNASQSHEGRTKIADLLIRMQKRDAEIVNLYRTHVGDPKLIERVQALSEKPIFTPQETQWLELQGRASQMNSQPGQTGGGVVDWQDYFKRK